MAAPRPFANSPPRVCIPRPRRRPLLRPVGQPVQPRRCGRHPTRRMAAVQRAVADAPPEQCTPRPHGRRPLLRPVQPARCRGLRARRLAEADLWAASNASQTAAPPIHTPRPVRQASLGASRSPKSACWWRAGAMSFALQIGCLQSLQRPMYHSLLLLLHVIRSPQHGCPAYSTKILTMHALKRSARQPT